MHVPKERQLLMSLTGDWRLKWYFAVYWDVLKTLNLYWKQGITVGFCLVFTSIMHYKMQTAVSLFSPFLHDKSMKCILWGVKKQHFFWDELHFWTSICTVLGSGSHHRWAKL